MARQPELHGIRFLCLQLAALVGVLLFQRSATAGEQALGVALLQQVNASTFHYDIDLKDSGRPISARCGIRGSRRRFSADQPHQHRFALGLDCSNY